LESRARRREIALQSGTGSALTPRVQSADWSRGSSGSRFRLPADLGRIAQRGDGICKRNHEYRERISLIITADSPRSNNRRISPRDYAFSARARARFPSERLIADRCGDRERRNGDAMFNGSFVMLRPVSGKFLRVSSARLSAESGCGFSATDD